MGVVRWIQGRLGGVPITVGADEENKQYPLLVAQVDSDGNVVSPGVTPASALEWGQNANVGTDAEQLTEDDVPCREVLIQADAENAGLIYVGNATVQTIALPAGQSISLPVANVNVVYVRASENDQVVGWVAIV